MKRKNKRERRKSYILFLLLVSGVMLATSTYAWFTVNRLVTINTLNVRVEASGGMDISVDGIDWKATVDATEIAGAINTYGGAVNQLPDKLEPVSTGGIVDTTRGYMEMYYGNVENDTLGNYILSSVRSVETNSAGSESDGVFIAFDVFIRVSNPGMLYLTDSSGATYTGTNVPGIENAVRFAFLVKGNTASESALGTIQGLNRATSDDLYIWEPNYDVHTDFGIANAKDVYNIDLNNTGNARVEYDGIINVISKENNVTIRNANATRHPGLFQRVNVDIATISNFTNYQELFNINSGITKIRIYIWLEGQDVDCENNSAVGNIDFNFQFSTNPS